MFCRCYRSVTIIIIIINTVYDFAVVLKAIICIFQSGSGYGDLFSATWKAFTDHPVVHLNVYDGKKVASPMHKDRLCSL